VSADTSFIAEHVTLLLSVLLTGIWGNRVFALVVSLLFYSVLALLQASGRWFAKGSSMAAVTY
jgi:hypothetical protein